MKSTYSITGMTCGHCVAHVTEEVKAIAGVQDVVVTLDPGQMVLTSDSKVSFEAVKAAVAEAGDYVVTPA